MTERPPSVPVRLPGVGERLDVVDREGRPVHLIRQRGGDAAIHVGSGPPLELDATAATVAGAFLSGHYLMPAELRRRLDGVLGGLVFDWLRIPSGGHAVGRSIEELAVRRRTGVTVVAILRGSVPIVGPDPSTRFEGGDELVIVGAPHDRDALVAYLEEGR